MTEDSPITTLLTVMARLRDPDGGCPWDLEQDFASIAPYTIEEAYEVADAIEREDWDALEGELGDLLLQVVFHSQIARERQLFDFNAVARAITEKMIRRHPHVFGDASVPDARAQSVAWEETKRQERERAALDKATAVSRMDDIPATLPSLLRAHKMQKRAAQAGFDWPDTVPVFAKIEEEIGEIRQAMQNREPRARLASEVGDLLFACVNLARHLGVDADSALRAGNASFERRFRAIEAMAAAQGRPMEGMTLVELDALWDEAKAAERALG